MGNHHHPARAGGVGTSPLADGGDTSTRATGTSPHVPEPANNLLERAYLLDHGKDPGVHARSAMGGFDGMFSIEPEIIVAIPPALARDIIMNRGWVFPLPPVMLDKVKAAR